MQAAREGFYSSFFLVPKKNGELRPVMNLKPLNSFIVKKHFKMDTLAKVINLLKKEDYAISLDLKDAYLNIPVHKSHRKYLRFCVKGKCYQFKATCFGPTQVPRVFTKIVTVIAAFLRIHNIRLYVPGRLVHSKLGNNGGAVRSRDDFRHSFETGIHNQFREIISDSKSNNYIPWRSVQTSFGTSFSQDREVRKCNSDFDHKRKYSFSIPSCSWTHGLMYRSSPIRLVTHASSSTSFALFLETSF